MEIQPGILTAGTQKWLGKMILFFTWGILGSIITLPGCVGQ